MRRLLSVLGLAGSVMFLQPATPSLAVHCGPEGGGLSAGDIGGVDVAGDCTLSANYDCTADTIINIPGSLTITAGFGIDCSGTDGALATPGVAGFDLTLNVGGDLIVQGFMSTDGG